MKPLTLLFALAAVLGQAPSAGQLQTVVVTASNPAGQYVTNLKLEGFILEENGARQQLTRFSGDVDAISLGILKQQFTSDKNVGSGGCSTVVDIPDLLSDLTIQRMIAFVQQIEIELRGQYALSYYSTTPGSAAGKTIRVRAGAAENRVQVRCQPIEQPAGKK